MGGAIDCIASMGFKLVVSFTSAAYNHSNVPASSHMGIIPNQFNQNFHMTSSELDKTQFV